MIETLNVRIMFVSANGECKATSPMVLLDNGETDEELLSRILNLTTDWLRQRWYRIEVSAPEVQFINGLIRGGYHRLLVTRNVDF